MSQYKMIGRRTIIWNKWHDPIQTLVNGVKMDIAYEPEEDEDDEEYHAAKSTFGAIVDSNPQRVPESRAGYTGPAIYSPAGIIPLNESNTPSALYNFWMGHANFGITKNIEAAIANVPGVESLDVFTRYRFRVGIGLHFKQDAVKASIDEAVQVKDRSTHPIVKIGTLLANRFPFWAIMVSPGGDTKCFGGATTKEVEAKLSTEMHPEDNLVTSWELPNGSRQA